MLAVFLREQSKDRGRFGVSSHAEITAQVIRVLYQDLMNRPNRATIRYILLQCVYAQDNYDL